MTRNAIALENFVSLIKVGPALLNGGAILMKRIIVKMTPTPSQIMFPAKGKIELETGKMVAKNVIGYDKISPKKLGNQNIDRDPRTDSIA
jgi:hypothetical protein